MSEITTTEVAWSVLVDEAEDRFEPETEYEFSSGREFTRPSYNNSRGVYADDE